ncbi:thiamine-monophosphate kinase [Oceaniferula spumae]|uniref:Thiamine-monophosphate kinase n=1 Tax=Oceaniferula spumae TaxID=2979115 RepID=A0AAT9FG95_9BACT
MKHLREIGEDALIARLIAGLNQSDEVIVGPGDDCAVVDVGNEHDYQLLKTDCLVEGVHYLSEAPADQVGRKAVARVISDFAAMGGRPAQLLVTIVMPGGQSVEYVEQLYKGMNSIAEKYGADICGGETSSVPSGAPTVISISGTGWVDKMRYVTRSGGQPGDRILVTGLLGGSISGKHLTFEPRVTEANWLAEFAKPHAMMDLSDGLAKDLPRLAKMSGCGFKIDESSVPCNPGSSVGQAIGDGEDYELLFAIPADQVTALKEKWAGRFPDLQLTDVGELTKADKGDSGQSGGWEHFKS